MNINRQNVVGVEDYIYKSVLYPDYYAVDFYVSQDGQVLKMRYPFKTNDGAQKMLDFLHKKTDVQPRIDYRREVWYLTENKTKVR